MDIDNEERPADPMDIDMEGEYRERPRHTGMTQDLSNLMIGLDGTMVDLEESDNEFELASGNEDLPEDSPKIQPKTKKRSGLQLRLPAKTSSESYD